ncbi:hypothetical protein [Myxococcus phage Mx1]|nr:hypothetical protein [Myxococcus phage Mx1]
MSEEFSPRVVFEFNISRDAKEFSLQLPVNTLIVGLTEIRDPIVGSTWSITGLVDPEETRREPVDFLVIRAREVYDGEIWLFIGAIYPGKYLLMKRND